MMTPQQILVPTDFSQYAEKALQEGLFLAKQFNARLHLLHVVPDIKQCSSDYCLNPTLVEQYRTGSIQASKQNLKNELDKHPEAKEVQISINVRLGQPAEEILHEENEKNIDLIVIATHGRSGVLKYLMGSVADRVSHRAKCKVLLIRA